MKKNAIIASVLMLVFSNSVLAQDAKPSMLFGIKLGLNGATTSKGFGSGSNFKDPGMKLGLAGGIFVHFPLGENWGMQPELLYSSEGSLQEGKIGSVTGNNFVTVFTTKLNYLNIPFMFQYRGNKKGFYGEAGPQLGFQLSAKLDNKFPPTGVNGTTNVQTYFRGAAWSFGFGTGYNFSSGLGIGLRYNLGLTNIDDIPGQDWKSNVLHVGVHYRFKGK
jgi:opacity protein-like surface antigen